MKIVHVITGLDADGAENMLARLTGFLRPPEYQHVVISLTGGGALEQRMRESGAAVHFLKMKRSAPSISALFNLRELIRNVSPDVVHGWMYHGNLAATMATAANLKLPVLWNIRHSLYDLRHEKIFTRMVIRTGAYLSRRPYRLIYCSETSADQHREMGFCGSNSCLIPNGFDCNTFRPNLRYRQEVRSELQFKEDDLLIGLIARYHPMKDHENFLRAAAILKKTHSRARFLLVGRGVDQSNLLLKRLIGDLALEGSIKLLGERSDIPRLLPALDIASSSSFSEAFSNSIGEAMACAVPCVATDVGDARRIIGDAGLVVRPRDPDALASAWTRLIEDGRQGREALGVLARERILERYSLPAVMRQYAQLYMAATGTI